MDHAAGAVAAVGGFCTIFVCLTKETRRTVVTINLKARVRPFSAAEQLLLLPESQHGCLL